MIFRTCLILFIYLASGGAANAQTCTFSATPIAFGNINTLTATSSDVVGTITASCNTTLNLLGSTSVTINIGSGSGGAAGSARQLRSATTNTTLDYQLYIDSARTQVLGSIYWPYGGQPLVMSDGTLVTLLSGSTVQIPIYGRTFGGQNAVAPGTYRSDFAGADVLVDYTICTALFLCTDYQTSFSFEVTAQVNAECLASATTLDFGSVGVLDTSVDAASRVELRCTAQTDYDVGLSYGFHGDGPTARFMQDSAGNRIQYGLYRDPSRTLPWGIAEDGMAFISAGSGSLQQFPVYGRVPPQATPPPNTYSDTVVVTVTY